MSPRLLTSPPPHPVNLRALRKHSFAVDGKTSGAGTLELPCVATEMKKEGKCPVHSQHCSTFHWSYSQVVDLMLLWLTSAFDSAILIKTSWAMIPLHDSYLCTFEIYLFQIVKYYEKVNIIHRSMIVKLEISSRLNYSQILDQQKFRSMTKKKCQLRTIAPDFWLD